MRFMKGRTRRLRAAVVGVAVATAGLFVGGGANAINSSFTEPDCTGASGELNIQSVSVSNDSNNVTYGVTMCSSFAASNVNRVAWQFSFTDGGGLAAPVDNCMTVSPSSYTGVNHNALGFLAYVTTRCVGATNGLGGSPDASGSALIGTAPVTKSGNSLSIVLPIPILRQAGLGGANSYGFRVVTRDTDSAAHLNSNTPQDAAPSAEGSYFLHSLNSSTLTMPRITIGNVSKKEGSRGTSSFVFPITLSASSSRAITVQYTTADGTATSTDYTPVTTPQTVTIAAGATTASITVPVKADRRREKTETFTVNLSNATNAAIGNFSATATIKNDD